MGVGVGKNKDHIERAWYPSGPRINAQGKQIETRIEYRDRPAEPAEKLPNPDPANYEIVLAEEVGRFLVLKIHYPDCTNYEGNKILVFEGIKPLDLLRQKLIDPHFFVNKKIASPIARFVPTPEGWNMAIRFAKAESVRS